MKKRMAAISWEFLSLESDHNPCNDATRSSFLSMSNFQIPFRENVRFELPNMSSGLAATRALLSKTFRSQSLEPEM